MWHAEFSNTIVSREEITDISRAIKSRQDLVGLTVAIENKTYSVRLSDGMFSVNSIDFYAINIPPKELTDIRPIWFIRESVEFNITSINSKPTTQFIAIGYQANHKGKNIKRYLAIYPGGKFVIHS